ncbi:MAG TPA: hypothetical protein VGM06_23865 [Polyangiaceae bacterium]|jgi:hypothetical protein
MNFTLRRRVLLFALLAVVPAAASASADTSTPKPTKDRCIDANTRAQSLRRSGDFAGTREQLRMCADAHCPRMVRDDCAARFDELERAQPTIVFDAKSPEGADLSAVDVHVDGKALATKLDGTALSIDPGEHTLTFDVSGQPTVTKQLIVREGEKARHEVVVIGTPKPAAAPSPVLPATPPPSPPEAHSSTGRTIGLVVGGVGLAGIAAGSVFGLLTKSAIDRQDQDCPSANNCSNHASATNDHDQAVRDGLFSEVGFIAGGALFVGGAIVFLVSGSGAPHAVEPTTGIVVTPSVGPSGAGLSLKGIF